VEQVKESIEAAVLSRLSPKVKEVVWRRSDGRLEQDGWLKPGARCAPSSRIYMIIHT
jgi:hypothetical protein